MTIVSEVIACILSIATIIFVIVVIRTPIDEDDPNF